MTVSEMNDEKIVTPLDESLSRVNQARAAKMIAADDFIAAVLSAARSGASQRIIGDAADLSHARIGQIVREYRQTA